MNSCRLILTKECLSFTIFNYVFCDSGLSPPCLLWTLIVHFVHFSLSGVTEVSAKNGDISISSTSGTLKAVTNTGNIDVSLSRHDNVILETKEGKLP